MHFSRVISLVRTALGEYQPFVFLLSRPRARILAVPTLPDRDSLTPERLERDWNLAG